MGNQARIERESKAPVPGSEHLFNKPSFPYLNPILGGVGQFSLEQEIVLLNSQQSELRVFMVFHRVLIVPFA